jgi:hypothetical protein
MLLPALVLAKPKRARRSIVKELSHRLDLFCNGDWKSLWDNFCAMKRSVKAHFQQTSRTRALKLARRGEFSRAVQALTAGKVAAATETTKAKLQEKHPKAAKPIGIAIDEAKPPTSDLFTKEQFQNVLRSLPFGSACGNSGLRYEHLRALYGTPAEGALYVFCKSIVTSSAIPEDWRPWFFAGKLVALEKGPTDVRPIAMGEVFTKLVGKLVCEGQREEMAEHMKG